MLIQFGLYAPNAFIQYTLPLAYPNTKYCLLNGGGDYNSITWPMSVIINESTIQLGSRGTQSWSWANIYYLTIGFLV